MKLTLPLPPNRANARWHWRREKELRDSYFMRCLVMHGLRWRDAPLAYARISATLYVWNISDMDNLMARMKWPVDWLVHRGYITNDDPAHLEWTLPMQQIDRKNPRVEIELEAIG